MHHSLAIAKMTPCTVVFFRVATDVPSMITWKTRIPIIHGSCMCRVGGVHAVDVCAMRAHACDETCCIPTVRL